MNHEERQMLQLLANEYEAAEDKFIKAREELRAWILQNPREALNLGLLKLDFTAIRRRR